jgi:membrane protease YdiL (CAAX protease family)
MNLAKILPLAIVMIAGPQILSAIFLATTERWRQNTVAYVAGASLSISIIVAIAYYVSDGAAEQGASNEGLYVVVLVLLLFAALRTYLKREESEPPKWMGKLQQATPGFSFKLGFLLLGVFPTDIVTSVAVGTFLSSQGDPLWHYLGFLGLTLLLLALPALTIVALGERGQALLPKVRDWMNNNSWIVNEIVIGLFIALTIDNLIG